MTTIREATPADAYDVALRMREADFAEFTAVSRATSRVVLAEALSARQAPIRLCAEQDGVPVCIGGFLESRPGVLTCFFYATDDFSSCARSVARYVRRMFDRLEADGIHRIEAVSAAVHTDAHRWMKLLGMDRETGTLRCFGKNREDFLFFARVRGGAHGVRNDREEEKEAASGAGGRREGAGKADRASEGD